MKEIAPGYQGVVIKIHVNPTNKNTLFFNLKYLNIILMPKKIEIEHNVNKVSPFINSRIIDTKFETSLYQIIFKIDYFSN